MLSFLSMKDGRKISQEECMKECRELIEAMENVPNDAVPNCFVLTKYPTGHTSKGQIISIESIRAMEKALGGPSNISIGDTWKDGFGGTVYCLPASEYDKH